MSENPIPISETMSTFSSSIENKIIVKEQPVEPVNNL
jgi:hypothetical protein